MIQLHYCPPYIGESLLTKSNEDPHNLHLRSIWVLKNICEHEVIF